MPEAFVDIGLRKEDFGLHSLRSNGVTLAANKGLQINEIVNLRGMVYGNQKTRKTGIFTII